MTIHIRNFTHDDADAVHAVALTAWSFTYQNIFDAAFIDNFVNTNYAPEQLRRLITLIEKKDMFFVVAEQEGRVVGFCNIGRTQYGAELYRIYLLPEFMGQGIGKALLANGEQYLHEQGFDAYFCFVHSANEIGKRFYAKQGFHHLVKQDQEGEWCMEKRLAKRLA